MSKDIKWLHEEVDRWAREGLIGPDQAQAIRARYVLPASSVSWGKIIFSTIGAVLFGLGIILLFAYNWEKMHKFEKLAIIFLSLLIAHSVGLWLRRTEGTHKAAGEGLNVLGTMLFGAGIWLIAQIYHIDEHFPNAFFAWGLGGLAMAWALPSVSQGIIASVLLAVWNGCETAEFNNPNYIAVPLMLVTLVPLAWRLRSRVLLGVIVSCAGAALLMTGMALKHDVVLPMAMFCSCGLIAWGLIMENNKEFPGVSSVFSFFGWVPFMVIVFILSFKAAARELLRIDFHNDQVVAYFFITAAFAFVSWFLAIYKLQRSSDDDHWYFREYWAVFATLIAFVYQIASGVGAGGWTVAGFYNLVFLFYAIFIIIYGCKHSHMAWATLGCLLFGALAMARYADLFESLIMRAIVFFIIGAGIFGVGNFYSKIKKDHREGGNS